MIRDFLREKNNSILIFCALSLSACSTLKKPAATTAQPSNRKVEFIEGISTRRPGNATRHYNKREVGISRDVTMGSANLENAQSWQFKYAQLLDVPVENVQNYSLYDFIEEWWGTPYRLGGKNKSGIDCSGFVSTLLTTVFQMSIMGNSADLYSKVTRLRKEDLHEGDLVFFRIHHKRISHVGVYLENDKFVHASTSSGVMISDLNEPYWKRYFAGAGRPL